MPDDRSQHQELPEFGSAIALANEIESAEKELLDSGWGGYPWEHLGDASRDIAKLIRGLREANGLIEQLEAAHAEIDNLNERIELRAEEDSIYRVYDAEVERRQAAESKLRALGLAVVDEALVSNPASGEAGVPAPSVIPSPASHAGDLPRPAVLYFEDMPVTLTEPGLYEVRSRDWPDPNPATTPKGVGGAPWHPKGANQVPSDG